MAARPRPESRQELITALCQEPTPPRAPGLSQRALERRQLRARIGRKLVESLYEAQLDIDRNGLSHMALEREELRRQIKSLPGDALLPHYVFALRLIEGAPVIHILPLIQWRQAGDPIQPIPAIDFERWFHPVHALLPEDSSPFPAAQAVWRAPGFERENQTAELFAALLDSGLRFEPGFQAFLDAKDRACLTPLLLPALEARALGGALPEPLPSKKTPRI